MGRKTYRRKHSRKQKGGGCGCGGSTVLGFPQTGGQMNSIIGSPTNSDSVPGMNSSMSSRPRNTSMSSMPMNTGMNSTPMNTGMNSSMSFNNGKYNNNKSNSPFLSASNFASGGFLGMFNSPSSSQTTTGLGAITSSVTPTNTGAASMSTPTNRPSDVNTRVDDLEKRLRKLETGGGFFGGGKLRRKRTRKHKSRKH